MDRHVWLSALLAGLAATAALVGLLLLASTRSLVSFVPLDIADALIRLTPGAVATRGIESLGPLAKQLIELTGALIFVVAGGLVAVLYSRAAPRPWLQAGVGLGLVPLALTLLVQMLGGGLRDGLGNWLLTGLLYALWGVTVVALVNRLAVSTAPTLAEQPERRAFLLRSGGTLIAVAIGSTAIARLLERSGVGGQVAGAGQALPISTPAGVAPSPNAAPSPVVPTGAPRPTTAPATSAPAQATTTAPTAAPTETVPTAAPVEASPAQEAHFVRAPASRSPFNTNETLYVISSATRDPGVDVSSWRLEVSGAFDNPFSLSYEELLALPRVDQTSTLECISNEVGNYLIGNCTWNGVRLRDLLERAGVQEGVVDIKFTAAEGYTESVPLAKALDPTSLIAYGIDGEALTVPHGFPARLIVPGLYGEKNIKWLTAIEAVREDYQGYWQQRGWTDTAIIETTSVIDTNNPFLGQFSPLQREGGVVPLGGIAFAGNRGISAVELRIDDGPWQPARLDPQSDPLQWRFWRFDWTAQPGSYRLTVRATDGAGVVQTEAEREPHPNGATGYHSFTVEVA